MAQGVGSANAVRFGEDTFGGKLWGAVDYKGPTSYVQGGDLLDPKTFGFPNAVVALFGSVDESNTYFVIGRPMQKNVTQWQLVWYLKAGGEVTAGTPLNTFTVRLGAIGV